MIKPIETHYRGYRFRSRLEARWAVFLDAADVPYSYEPEGFKISATIDCGPDTLVHVQRFYLPDFWLPTQDHFLEIKPAIRDEAGEIEWPDRELQNLQCAFEKQTGKRLVVLCGEPGPWECSARDSYCSFILSDRDYAWCECSNCGALGLQYGGRAERNIHHASCPSRGGFDRDHNTGSPRLRRAYDRARAARFEHGEQP